METVVHIELNVKNTSFTETHIRIQPSAYFRLHSFGIFHVSLLTQVTDEEIFFAFFRFASRLLVTY